MGIARAIVANPTIVVGDEPTGNLDSRTAEQILELIGAAQCGTWHDGVHRDARFARWRQSRRGGCGWRMGD